MKPTQQQKEWLQDYLYQAMTIAKLMLNLVIKC
jgi:hypothetical protein